MKQPFHGTVAVLAGGTSPERDVSLDSGRSVCAALRSDVLLEAGAQVKVRSVEIADDGSWIVDGESGGVASGLPVGEALQQLADVDVFFFALHGGDGEDGTLQGLLTAHGKLHTGSGVVASGLCMDKVALRGLAAADGIAVAAGHVFDRRDGKPLGEQIPECLIKGSTGWVVKPRFGGSSVGTYQVRSVDELAEHIGRCFEFSEHVLVESWVEGVEVSCGVLGNSSLRTFPPIEIQPSEGHFFDYQQKYDSAGTGAREICPSVSLPAEVCLGVEQLAERLHRLANCAGYSRVDFIVPKSGTGSGSESWGAPVLLEINTLPGLTPRSLLPQEAAAVGVSYEELCHEIVSLAAPI